MRLCWDETGRKLVLDPAHPIGQPNAVLDLRYWENCLNIINGSVSAHQMVHSVLLSGHSECSDSLIAAMQIFRPFLRFLDISHCPLVSSECLSSISGFLSLTALDISHNHAVQDSALTALCALPRLTNLNISHCIGLGNTSIVTIANTLGPKLMQLQAAGLQVTHEAANTLMMRAEGLDCLDLSACSHLTFVGIVVLDRGIQQYLGRRLTWLSVSNCPLSALALKYISTALPALQVLHAVNVLAVTDEFLHALLTGCEQLTEVYLTGCRALSGKALDILSASPRMSRMRVLDIGEISPVNVTTKSSVLDLLAVECALQSLELTQHTYLTDAHFPAGSNVSSCLRTLSVANCPQLSPNAYLRMLSASPVLSDLNLSNNDHVTDTVLMALITCCPRLHKLKVNACRSLTDRGFIALCSSRRMALLEEIFASFGKQAGQQYTDAIWGPLLTNKTLKLVVLSNQSSLSLSKRLAGSNYALEKMDLRGCNKLTDTGIRNLLNACYRLVDVQLPAHVKDKGLGLAAMPIGVRYRDALTRRRLLELHAIRVIQTAFTVHKIWKRFRTRLSARRILAVYREYRARCAHSAAVSLFTRRRAVRCIERAVWTYRVLFNRSARCIQVAYRKYQQRMERIRLIARTAAVVRLQTRVRGMLTRISERYIILQIYMKLPPFWKALANVPVPGAYGRSGGRARRTGARAAVRAAGSIMGMPEKKRIHSNKTELYEITQLKDTASELLYHIIHKKPSQQAQGQRSSKIEPRKLAAKLEQIVPQTFDLTPYVSLSDGRKLCFHSSPSSLFGDTFLTNTANTVHQTLTEKQLRFLEGNYTNAVSFKREKKVETAEHLPLHIFNYKYWPLSRPQAHTAQGDDTLFNPSLNSFEVILNAKTVVYCDCCVMRLSLLHCSICCQGYCFHCAYSTHSSLTTRSHVLSLQVPRVVRSHQISNSLVHHISQASALFYSLGYLMKFMASASEVARIRTEKRLVEEYEKAEEKKRLAYLRAQEEYSSAAEHALTLTLWAKVLIAKRIVKAKRTQLSIEQRLKALSKLVHGIQRLQVLVRRYLIKVWLGRSGVFFTSVRKYYRYAEVNSLTLARDMMARSKSKAKGLLLGQGQGQIERRKVFFNPPRRNAKVRPTLTTGDVRNRCVSDLRRRAVYCRSKDFGDLEASYVDALQYLTAAIAHWKTAHSTFAPQVASHTARRDSLYIVHKELQIASTLTPGMSSNEVKVAAIRLDAACSIVEIWQNSLWWVEQVYRALVRKRKILEVRYADAVSRLQEVAVEYYLLDRIRAYISSRLQGKEIVPPSADGNLDSCGSWLSAYHGYVINQLILLDTQQQSLLQEERARLDIDLKESSILQSLLTELTTSLAVASQLQAERIYLEKVVLLHREEVRYAEELMTLKAKSKILTNQSIDSLKLALQAQLDAFDKTTLESYAFPQDGPDLRIEEMEAIEVVLLEPASSMRHIAARHFLLVYLLQPWLQMQCVYDIRYEERIAAKSVRYMAYKEEISVKQTSIAALNQQILDQLQQAKDTETAVLVHMDGLEEDEAERIAREAKLATFRSQLQVILAETEMTRKALLEVEAAVRPLQHAMKEVWEDIEDVKRQLAERLGIRER